MLSLIIYNKMNFSALSNSSWLVYNTWWYYFIWGCVYRCTNCLVAFHVGFLKIFCNCLHAHAWQPLAPVLLRVKFLRGTLPPGLIFWQVSDMLQLLKSISYWAKELEWPQVLRSPSSLPLMSLVEVCGDRQFKEHCAMIQLSFPPLKCYF